MDIYGSDSMKSGNENNGMLRALWAGMVAVAILCIAAGAAWAAPATGNVSATDRYAWSETAGWTDFRPENGGVTVRDAWLSGYAWNESVGWIKLGADGGGPYANDSATDWGVNRSGTALSGYAWSEAAGWIHFAPSGGGVTVDAGGGFDGWAWSDGIGWIHFASPEAAPIAYALAYENGAPTVADIADLQIAEDGTTGAIPFTVGDLETAAGTLIVTAASNNTALVPSGNIVVGGGGADRTLTVIPAANKHGNATVTVTVSDGTRQAQHAFVLTVTSVPDTYTVTPSAGDHGALDPGTAQGVTESQATSFTVTPDTGYHIDTVTGCDGTLSGSTYTTGAVTENCTVSASFSIDTFTVTPAAAEHGSLAPDTAQTIDYNATTSFTVTPETGYHVVTVTGCGGTLDGSTYTTGPVTESCTVEAFFAPDTYTVTPEAGAYGRIVPGGPQSVDHGQSASFTVAPHTDYAIDSVTGCGGTLAGSTYTTAAITGDCTVSATFAYDTLRPVDSGTDVNLTLPKVSVTFDEVTGGGAVTATPVETPAAPANFRLPSGASYEIATTASFSGPVEVCIGYDEWQLADLEREPKLRLFHRTDGGWTDITTTVDTEANIVCGETTSFSPFSIAEPTPPADPTRVPVMNGWWLLGALGAGLGLLRRRKE